MKLIKIITTLLFVFPLISTAQVRMYTSLESRLMEDLSKIESHAQWKEHTIGASFHAGDANIVSISCNAKEIHLDVTATEFEKASTLYHGIFKLGFLFPHPRWQITPTEKSARAHCGKSYEWKPAFQHRGFHLHTLHPNEWVKGFLEGDQKIAEDTVRWLARNRQNAIDLNLLRKNWVKQLASVNKAFNLAKEFGISRGVSNGAALQQQNSWKMIPLWKAITGTGDEKALIGSLRKLDKHLEYDWMSMEFGTSEFTAVNYDRALKWMALTENELRAQGKKLFAKIHVSTNQNHTTYGNFNFLVRHASKDIGIFPHTVMFYGLYDEHVPMYGNDNFHHLRKFIQEEKDSRDIWYFPESSYWIAMDIDVPLFLTDYLTVRSVDMKNLNEEGIEGHFTFTSGHELGYWLFDWTIALNTDLNHDFDPLSGLKLLGENSTSWKKILDFQTKHIKLNQTIAILSFSNLQDEVTKNHRIHERHTIKEVARSSLIREEEILKLEKAVAELPDISGVKNKELKLMLEVTELRFHHALAVRKALRFENEEERKAELNKASELRVKALAIMSNLKAFERYPEAKLFERNKNPTSYQYGYLWPAATLHFWEREEAMVRNNCYSPFYKNIYNVIDIIF